MSLIVPCRGERITTWTTDSFRDAAKARAGGTHAIGIRNDVTTEFAEKIDKLSKMSPYNPFRYIMVRSMAFGFYNRLRDAGLEACSTNDKPRLRKGFTTPHCDLFEDMPYDTLGAITNSKTPAYFTQVPGRYAEDERPYAGRNRVYRERFYLTPEDGGARVPVRHLPTSGEDLKGFGHIEFEKGSLVLTCDMGTGYSAAHFGQKAPGRAGLFFNIKRTP